MTVSILVNPESAGNSDAQAIIIIIDYNYYLLLFRAVAVGLSILWRLTEKKLFV